MTRNDEIANRALDAFKDALDKAIHYRDLYAKTGNAEDFESLTIWCQVGETLGKVLEGETK